MQCHNIFHTLLFDDYIVCVFLVHMKWFLYLYVLVSNVCRISITEYKICEFLSVPATVNMMQISCQSQHKRTLQHSQSGLVQVLTLIKYTPIRFVKFNEPDCKYLSTGVVEREPTTWPTISRRTGNYYGIFNRPFCEELGIITAYLTDHFVPN